MKLSKKYLCVGIAAVLLISSAVIAPAAAGDSSPAPLSATGNIAAIGNTSGDYEYEVLDDGTVEINGYTGSATALTIPSELDGKTVTSIEGRYIFFCLSLTSVTIPDSVTYISYGAFNGCSALTSITVESGNPWYSSNNGALLSKDKTELICCPGGKSAYTIPDSVTYICDWAFDDCWTLESIEIPSSVKSIGYCAFKFCSSLTSITIPDSVKYIDDLAFAGCSSLTSVTIPDSVTYIGDWAFDGCSALTSITVESGNPSYSSNNGALLSKDKTELICCPGGMSAYTIPDSVTYICDWAFESCSSLENIEIPSSVTSIGYGAFEGCSSLTSITIPDSVTYIGDWTFNGCSALTSISIPASVTSIDEEAFLDCSSLTSITIPDSVTSIGNWAFGFRNNDDFEKEKVAGFTITGYTGSAAQKYAEDNGFEFITLTVDPSVIGVLGDPDGSGAVNVKDATLIQKFAASIVTLTDEQKRFADVNADGNINVKDATAIQKYAASIDTGFKIGQKV